MTLGTQRRWIELLNVLAMAAIVALALSLRLDGFTASVYGDEISTYERARETVWHTLATRSYPLTEFLVKLSLMFGDTEAALRLPALLAGLAGIVAAYGFLRAVHSRTAGLAGALVIAVNPFHVFHSQWARYYTLLMLFALLALWCLYRVVSRGHTRDWILYGLAAAGALLAHVCFLPAFAALKAAAGLCLLVRPPGGTTRRARVRAMAALAVVAVASASFTLYAVLPSQTVLQAGGAASIGPGADGDTVEASAGETGVQVHPPDGRGLGGGLTLRDPAAGTVRYRLTFYDCVEYLKRYFWTNSPWVWPFLTFLGLVGLLDALVRLPRLGVLLAAGMLSPLPLFFVTASHWYHPRYFSFLFVFAVVLIVFGLLALARFLARVAMDVRSIPLMRPENPGDTHMTARVHAATVAITAVALVVLAPKATEALATYPVDGYLVRGELSPVRHPLRDWKSLYRVMGETIQPGDPIHHVSPRDRDAARYRPYYLPRFTAHAPENLVNPESYGPLEPSDLEALARRYPDRTLWFTGDFQFNAFEYQPFFAQAGAVERRFLQPGQRVNAMQRYGAVLWYLGAPTQNLVSHGGFENLFPAGFPEGVALAESAEAYAGNGALRIHRDRARGGAEANAAPLMLALPLMPMHYTPRNASFELVDGDQPRHWHTSTPGQVRVEARDDAPGGRRVLALPPAGQPVEVSQRIPMGLAPGRTVRIDADVYAEEPDPFLIALSFAHNGVTGQRSYAYPGGEGWRPFTVRLPVPDEAEPESITLKFLRLAGGNGTVFVDNIRIEVEEAAGRLDPLHTYSASMMVKTKSVRNARGSTVHPAGAARLAWTTADGRREHLEWATLAGDRDWTFIRSGPIAPGVDIPLDATELSLEVGLVQGSGTIWVDNAQFEPRPDPTPFTAAARMPHDETLAAVRGQLAPVSVSWE